MKKPLIADTHCDALMRMIDLGYSLDDDRLQVSVSKMVQGGHDIQIFACFIDPAVGRDRYISRTLQMIDLLKQEVRKNNDRIHCCESYSQVQRALSKRKKIALLGIEGGHAIGNDLGVLRCYRELGVVAMTLTWSNTNDWADSSSDVERWGGFTPFGESVVREMNRIRMMVDISHVSDKTFWHALRISTRPLIASHSSARAICNHHRNMSDEMIRALGEKGGVVFVNFFPTFVHQGFCDVYIALDARLRRRFKKLEDQYKELATYQGKRILRSSLDAFPRVGIKDVVRHVKHIAKVGGVEAVGLGSDFDGIPFWPAGLEDCTGYPRFCDALRKAGFKPSQIDKIASGNFLRVFKDCVGG